MVSFRAPAKDLDEARERCEQLGLEFSQVMRVLLSVLAGGGFSFLDALSPRLAVAQQLPRCDKCAEPRSPLVHLGEYRYCRDCLTDVREQLGDGTPPF